MQLTLAIFKSLVDKTVKSYDLKNEKYYYLEFSLCNLQEIIEKYSLNQSITENIKNLQVK